MEKNKREAICKRLRQLRKKADYSQIDIAELINIEQNTYSDLETGKRKIDIERILQLANIYGVSVDSILNPPPPIKVMVIKKQYFLQPL